MKNLFTLLLFTLLFSYGNAASFRGHNIDGYNFSCSLYNEITDEWSTGCLVIFSDSQATIYFSDGHITLDLDSQYITNPHQITCTYYSSSTNPPLTTFDIELSSSVIQSLEELK